MKVPILSAVLILTVASGLAVAQSRRATFTLRGEGDRGRCTIAVVVDDVAEVELRGEFATLRPITGRPPYWRRFECSAPMPMNPIDFQFFGVAGRGRQFLVRQPGDGGPGIVRIEDRRGGEEAYTFDVTWRFRRDFNPPPVREDYDRDEAYYRDREAWFRDEGWRRGLFRRVREDLDHVAASTFPGGGDEYRIDRTRRDLDALQGNLERRFYDERLLNGVIEALDRVVRDNRMRRRDREILADDLDRLRDFRARHDSWR